MKTQTLIPLSLLIVLSLHGVGCNRKKEQPGTSSTTSSSLSSPTPDSSEKTQEIQAEGKPEGKPEDKKDPLHSTAPKIDSCHEVRLIHQDLASHRDGEACLQHKNKIDLNLAAGVRLSPKSVCIRVNNTPVAFVPVKGQRGQFLIDAVAGPQAIVSIRYCEGSARCPQPCLIPKDEFMSALGNEGAAGGGWDESAQADDRALTQELQALQQTMNDGPQKVFTGWIQKDRQDVCKPQQVSQKE